MSLRITLACSALALAVIPDLALSQEQLFRTVKAAAGKPTRLGVIGNVTKECTPGPMPEIKVVTAPKKGTLAIRSGKSKAGSLKRCPNLEVPIRGVFYEANASANGADEVVYEVKRANGSTQTITARIEIGTGSSPATSADDSTDL